MARIKDDCVDNAIGMLKSRHCTFIGHLGQAECYLCDGKLWTVLGRIVDRCEDEDHQETLLRIIRYENRGTAARNVAVGYVFKRFNAAGDGLLSQNKFLKLFAQDGQFNVVNLANWTAATIEPDENVIVLGQFDHQNLTRN